MHRTSAATTSSKDTPMGCPVKPFVLRISRCFKWSPNTFRNPKIYCRNNNNTTHKKKERFLTVVTTADCLPIPPPIHTVTSFAAQDEDGEECVPVSCEK